MARHHSTAVGGGPRHSSHGAAAHISVFVPTAAPWKFQTVEICPIDSAVPGAANTDCGELIDTSRFGLIQA
jgi:hypothetical protein